MAGPTSESGQGDTVEPGSGGLRLAGALGALVLGLSLILVFGEEVPGQVARGIEAPAFELPLLDGSGSIRLADQRGKVVLINFWATWCKPCEDEMPSMERLYRQLDRAEFEMIAVSVDEDTDLVKAFRERLQISFPIPLDPSQDVARRYQTMGFPESLLVDTRGIVVERYVGPRDWDHPSYAARIQELLANP